MPDNKKKEGLTVLLFLVLLVLFINISKNLSLSFSKAGAKVKRLFQTTKLFLKFFFQISFRGSFRRLSVRKGKKHAGKGKQTADGPQPLTLYQHVIRQGSPLLESGCKSRDFAGTIQI